MGHQRHADCSPGRLLAQARLIGPKTLEFAEALMRERGHPEHGYRAAQGILRLGKTFGGARLEAACARALAVRAGSYRHVESILKKPGKPPAPVRVLAQAVGGLAVTRRVECPRAYSPRANSWGKMATPGSRSAARAVERRYSSGSTETWFSCLGRFRSPGEYARREPRAGEIKPRKGESDRDIQVR